MRSARTLSPLAVLVAVLVGGCGGQSALDPQAGPARTIATLWWWMLGIAGVVFAGAVFLLVLGALGRHQEGWPILGKRESFSTRLVVIFGMVIPVAVNIPLFVVANFVAAKDTEAPAAGSTRMTVEVTGHQWFWEIRYPGTAAVTANELHIPVGTRVNLVARTADVIHSFWVPQLNRKIDMIPGHTNRIVLEADRQGRYRGQCAEFCGLQHAHMAMYVFAQPRAAFLAWEHRQAAPAVSPSSPMAARGRAVFDGNACASCHQIRGTSARGQVGPDLTHVMARTTLAALAIPNRPTDLARWIRDPQHVKPGNRMPGLDLPDADLRAVTAYVESLK